MQEPFYIPYIEKLLEKQILIRSERANCLDAPHFLSGFSQPFSENGYIKKYRSEFFPEEVSELESLDKMKKRLTSLNRYLQIKS